MSFIYKLFFVTFTERQILHWRGSSVKQRTLDLESEDLDSGLGFVTTYLCDLE